MPRFGWVVLAILCTVLLGALPGLAAGGHPEGHAPGVSDLLFPAINFLLFLYVLRWAAGGAIGSFLRQRRSDVISALNAAAAAVADAEQACAETRARLAGVEREAELLRADMRAVAERERARRREIATRTAARISADARLIAEQETRSARAALRDETVTAALTETVALLRRQIKAPDHQRFVAEFLSEVGKQS